MGVKAIENLIKRSPDLDCVLLETTGLAGMSLASS